MEASPQSIGSTTAILDMDDDCLREVFGFLEPNDLSVVADVCSRFRENATESARPKIGYLMLSEDSTLTNYSQLRNFAASVEVLDLNGECR